MQAAGAGALEHAGPTEGCSDSQRQSEVDTQQALLMSVMQAGQPQSACAQQVHCAQATPQGLVRNSSMPAALKGAVIGAHRQSDVRRVAIAFDSIAVGRNLARWAFQRCLFPDDSVHLVFWNAPKVRCSAPSSCHMPCRQAWLPAALP